MHGSVRHGVHLFSKCKQLRWSHLMRHMEIGEVNRVISFATIESTKQAMPWVGWHHVSPSRSSHATPRHLALLATGLSNRTYTEFRSRLKRLPLRWYPVERIPSRCLSGSGLLHILSGDQCGICLFAPDPSNWLLDRMHVAGSTCQVTAGRIDRNPRKATENAVSTYDDG